MKNLPKWLVPATVIVIIAIVVSAASKFAGKPDIFLRGDVSIAGDLQSRAQGIETMFIILYDADNPAPMPYGALRERVSIGEGFRIDDLILTPQRVQVMRPGLPAPKNFRVKVRFDRDGKAGPDQPGDIVGEVARVAYGAEAVRLEAAKLIQ